MKSYAIILLGLVILCLGGCGHNSEVKGPVLPVGSFRLSVTDDLTNGDERVCSISVESRERPKYSVTWGQNSYGDWTSQTKAHDGIPYRERVIWLALSSVKTNGSGQFYAKTELRSGGLSLVGTDGAVKDTALEKRLTIATRDGVYKLGTPLAIGQLDGRELRLLVRDEIAEVAAR